MTTTLSPFEELEQQQQPERMKPREAITVGPMQRADIPLVAALRQSHPGGIPTMEPQRWSLAFESGRLVAAIGWMQERPGMVMVVEVDRVDGHWGKIGTLVLFKQFLAASKAQGIRVQALVIPKNEALKRALTQLGLHLQSEVWGAE